MEAVDKLLEDSFESKTARCIERSGRRWSAMIECFTLFLIFILCFIIRLFAVIRYESVIHEFDPYFNYRTSMYLTKEGIYEFWNWFDDGSWYPLGRVIGQTLYPGLMMTSYAIHTFMNFIGFAIDIRNVCVFLAPFFSGLTAIAAFLFTNECTQYPGAGLFSAFFIGISSSYLSRSVAGSYDNEGVAIFALCFSFYVFLKALNTGSILWGIGAVLAYGYMVASWGGYVFIINMVSVFMAACLILGKMTTRHFVCFNVFYVLGTVFCMNIPFVGFQAVTSSEHMASHGIFATLNAVFFAQFLGRILPKTISSKHIITFVVGGTVVLFTLLFLYLTMKGKTMWSGRSLTLLDPTYASKYVPIIASVSEHQPTTWVNFFMDLYILPMLMPLGFYVCFSKLSDGLLFLGIYGVLSVYFASIMVRLLLVLAPAAACLSGVGSSYILSHAASCLRAVNVMESKNVKTRRMLPSTALALVCIMFFWCCRYSCHSTFMASFAYSNPSIVLAHQQRDGSRLIQDDFRESYYWIRQNTHPKSTIASWWDYGYQIAVMSNRTVLTDNNTWNNTHIATMGLIMGSNEETAAKIMRDLDADYFLIIFGGVARYSSDDLNKFLWPLRIAHGVFPDQIHERDFINPQVGYTMNEDATPRLRNSILYKMSYYRVAEVTQGKDFVRDTMIGYPDIKFDYFTEAYTSENWMVRIFKLNEPRNRGEAVAGRRANIPQDFQSQYGAFVEPTIHNNTSVASDQAEESVESNTDV
eukprot:GEMP01011646.1.p1 GENE.GEMP01011646.1~~GEMP01011646.1.p1  ORF type:complete len:753 (+),score=114.41 GEMP01011646.1:24-2282(+)